MAGSARREGSDYQSSNPPKKFKARSDDCAPGWTLGSFADSKFEPPDLSCSASLRRSNGGVYFTSFGSARETGKAGPATGSGSDVDAVSQNSDSLAHDEEADAQTIASRRTKTGEGMEHSGQLVLGDTDSGVIHVNTDALAGVTATEEDAATGLRVLDSVADQVAQNGTEKQRVALDRGAGRGRANADPLP
jgi:hypothetical protein